jgi:uncharacterized protein (DUF433 family)
MTMTADMLKPSEAAVVAHVTLRDVHRVIDERILPDDLFSIDDGRHVRTTACFLIDFYFHSAKSLTFEERIRAINEAGSRLNKYATLTWAELLEEDWRFRDDFLVVDLSSFVKRSKERMDRLIAARDLVVTDPEILGGMPVIRGTRIPVHDIAASMAAGIPIDRILAAYPGLDRAKAELAKIYADANPPRGRPRSDLHKGAVITADRRVSRRRKTG